MVRSIVTEMQSPRHLWNFTVNEAVAKRMVKKQQMHWSCRGAYCLLQTRTAVLNGELRDHFEEWYPELSTGTNDEAPEIPVKMAA